MAMSYNRLWKQMIDKNLIKKDLREIAGLSTNVIAKMGKGRDVSTEILRKYVSFWTVKLRILLKSFQMKKPSLKKGTVCEVKCYSSD